MVEDTCKLRHIVTLHNGSSLLSKIWVIYESYDTSHMDHMIWFRMGWGDSMIFEL